MWYRGANVHRKGGSVRICWDLGLGANHRNAMYPIGLLIAHLVPNLNWVGLLTQDIW